MNSVLQVLIVFFVILSYKFLSNYIYYKKCVRFDKLYTEWLSKKDASFLQHKNEIISLFKRAGIQDYFVSVVQPITLGTVQTNTVSVFDNFPSFYKNIAAVSLRMFDEAIGVYKMRMKETVNPLYWIEFIIFLPKHILQYIGFDMNTAAQRACNVLLTFIWWILNIGFISFREQLFVIISNFFKVSL